MRRIATALSLIAALAAAPGVATAKVRQGPAGDAFYQPPTPLPGKTHGDVIWARKDSGATALPGAARSLRVLYRSTSLANKPVAVSGSISFPRRRPPRGGWPVITWGHGTDGIADVCAPTRRAPRTDPYHRALRAMWASWLRAGYAVALTDYEGLGTPGMHPFLIGRSEGRSMVDIVRAARRIDRRVGRRVVAAGHSQGGQAALFAPAVAPKWTPELRLRGAFAYAPPAEYRDQVGLIRAVKDPSPLSAFVLLIMRGVEATTLSVPVQDLLSDRAKSFYPTTDSQCIEELYRSDSAAGMAPAELLREGANLDPLADYVETMDPANLALKVPVAISQGTSDNLVLKLFTDQLVARYRRRGIRTTYYVHEGATHSGVVVDNPREPLAFFKRVLR